MVLVMRPGGGGVADGVVDAGDVAVLGHRPFFGLWVDPVR